MFVWVCNKMSETACNQDWYNVYVTLHFCFGGIIIMNSLILIIFITILYYHI